jgi:hypothetical protein
MTGPGREAKESAICKNATIISNFFFFFGVEEG